MNPKSMKLMLCSTVSYVMFYTMPYVILSSTMSLKNINVVFLCAKSEVDCFYLFTTKTASWTLTHNLTSIHLQKHKNNDITDPTYIYVTKWIKLKIYKPLVSFSACRILHQS